MLARNSGQLTTKFIRSIDRPGRFGDGRGHHGLSIRAYTNAAGELNKIWQQRTTIDGQKYTIGLGTFPIITLQVARNRAFDNARKIALGEGHTKTQTHHPYVRPSLRPSYRDPVPLMARRRHRKGVAPRQGILQADALHQDLEGHYQTRPRYTRTNLDHQT